MLNTNFQPCLRSIITGGTDTVEAFRPQLYQLSEFDTGPVKIDIHDDHDGVTGVMLTRLTSDDYYSRHAPLLIYLVNCNDHYALNSVLWSINHRRKHNDVQQYHVVLKYGEFAELVDDHSKHQPADLTVTYTHDSSLSQLLESIAKSYLEHCKQHQIDHTKQSGQTYYKDRLPLWNGYLQVLSPSKLYDAVEYNCYDVVKENLLALISDVRYRWEYSIKSLINLCRFAVLNKRFEILCLLYTYLPKMGIKLPVLTPYAYVKSIINEIDTEITDQLYSSRLRRHRSRLTVTEDELQILHNFNPENIEKDNSPRNLPRYSKLPSYFDGLEQHSFKTIDQPVLAYGRLVSKLRRFMLAFNDHKGVNLRGLSAGPRLRHKQHRMIQELTYPYNSVVPKKKRIALANFSNSVVYKTLVEAVDKDNADLAASCINILRTKSIPLELVFNYINPDLPERTFGQADKKMPIIERVFAWHSLSVLRLLCTNLDTLAIVQRHIIKSRMIVRALEFSKLGVAELYLWILKDPQQALTLFDSTAVTTVAGYYDLYPKYSVSHKLYDGLNELSAIDELLKSALSLNMKLLTRDRDFRFWVANFVRDTLPKSSLLQQLYLPLLQAQQETLSRTLTGIELNPAQMMIRDSNLPNVKYLMALLALNRIYRFNVYDAKTQIYLRLYPHGIIAIAYDSEKLETYSKKLVDLHKQRPEASKGIVVYSGKKQDLKYPTGNRSSVVSKLANQVRHLEDYHVRTSAPRYPNQSASIKISSDNKRYVPISISAYSKGKGYQHHGFWAAFKNYGAMCQKNQPKQYRAAVTGGCMIGVTFYAQMLGEDGKIVKSIRLTHPDEHIPEGFRVDQLYCPYEPHLYEKYNFTHLRETMPFLKKCLKDKAPMYYDLPTTNYIMYGIRYYLNGVFTEDKFNDFIRIVKRHHKYALNELAAIGDKFKVTIIPKSTLDCLGLLDMPANKILNFVRDRISNSINSPYEVKAGELADNIVNELANREDDIGKIYRSIPKGYCYKDNDPLLALSRLDYIALYAYAKLDIASQNQSRPCDHDILGFMPQDEAHIFGAFGKYFADQYGCLDAIDWVPTIMPQTGHAKTSKLFYVEDGVDELTTLINKGLVQLQSAMISAISTDNPALYLKSLQDLIGLLVHAERENQTQPPFPHKNLNKSM